jgi:hypothetical protein
MAKLEAVVSADVTPFEKGLAQAAERAKEFSEKLGDVGKDLLKSLSGINIGEAMGIGVGVYTAKQLGEALIDSAREGLKEFQKFQDAVLSFKYTLPSAAGDLAEREKLAKEEAEAAEKRVGAFNFEEQMAAAQALMQASRVYGENVEKTNEMVKSLTALAIITRSTPAAEAENLRRALVSRREDSGEALGRFFKRTPGLEEQARLLRDQEAARRPEEAAEIQRMGIPEFMAKETRGKTDEEIIKLLTEMVSKAAPPEVVKEHAEIYPFEKLNAPLTEMANAFGEKLLPLAKALADALGSVLPAVKELGLTLLDTVVPTLVDAVDILKVVGTAASWVTTAFTPLREALERLATYVRDVIVKAFAPLRETMEKLGAYIQDEIIKGLSALNDVLVQAVHDIMAAVKMIAGWAHIAVPEPGAKAGGEAGEGGGEESEAAVKSAKEALEADTGIFSAAYIKGAGEAAAILAKAAAGHAEVMRKVNAEAEIYDVRAAARAQARRALIDRPRGGTEAIDKQYAAEAEAESKIINLRAEGTAKIIAAQEAEAERIAKIQDEARARDANRAEEDRHTLGMSQDELDARALVRNAEDAASATAINDAKDEAAEKIREADVDTANAIIDAQEAAAERIIDAQKSAALAQLEKLKGPYAKEEAPGGWETRSRFGKGGEIIEGSADRKAREERNAAIDEANRQWREMQRMAIEHEFEQKKRIIEDQLERQRPTELGLKRTHILQQEEHVKAIEAEKGRTLADQEFARAHGALGLPIEPAKEAKGRPDISRKVLAEILAKMFDLDKDWKKDWDKVFAT